MRGKIDEHYYDAIFDLNLLEKPVNELSTFHINLVLEFLAGKIESIEKKANKIINISDFSDDVSAIGLVSFVASRFMPEGIIKNAFSLVSPALLLTGIIGNVYVAGAESKVESMLEEFQHCCEKYVEFRNELTRRKIENNRKKCFYEIFPDMKRKGEHIDIEEEIYLAYADEYFDDEIYEDEIR